jgi:cytochrome c biogenesis protein CcdA
MVGAIIPIVYGNGHKNRVPVDLWVHSISGLAGGICSGVIVGWLGTLIFAHRIAGNRIVCGFGGIVAIAFALKEAGVVNFTNPQCTWQVSRSWMRFNPFAVTAGLFGFFLGFGLVTRINSCLYPVLVVIVLTGSAIQGALIMGVFGLVRTIPLWLIYRRLANRDDERWDRYNSMLARVQPTTRLASALLLTVFGALFLTAFRG